MFWYAIVSQCIPHFFLEKPIKFVCVTEQPYFIIFLTRLWSVYATLCFLIHRILEFQDTQLRMRINTKPNGKQK